MPPGPYWCLRNRTPQRIERQCRTDDDALLLEPYGWYKADGPFPDFMACERSPCTGSTSGSGGSSAGFEPPPPLVGPPLGVGGSGLSVQPGYYCLQDTYSGTRACGNERADPGRYSRISGPYPTEDVCRDKCGAPLPRPSAPPSQAPPPQSPPTCCPQGWRLSGTFCCPPIGLRRPCVTSNGRMCAGGPPTGGQTSGQGCSGPPPLCPPGQAPQCTNGSWQCVPSLRQ